jgi:hypothetical protein
MIEWILKGSWLVFFMKKGIFFLLGFLAGLILGSGCGSGTGNPEDSGFRIPSENKTGPERLDRLPSSVSGKKSPLMDRSGALTINIATTGSVLPPGTFRLLLTFDEVSVYKQGQGWISLPLKPDSQPMELFRSPSGTSAALTEPAEVGPGKYSRIRVGIKEANILILNSNHKIVIPNNSLKTEKDIEFEMGTGTPTNVVAVWQLGQSIQPFGGSYKLFPTFYAIDERKAASIHGSIKTETFGSGGGSHSSGKVWVIVYRDRDRNRRASSDEEIARLAVQKETDSSGFEIRWLPPQDNYIVTVEAGGRVIYSELVEAPNLLKGRLFGLNKVNPI